MLFSLVFVLITVLVHSSFSSPLKSFDLDESDFVPRVCIEIINNDNPFVQEIIWRSTKEINDKFDDKFYLLPLKSIRAKRNACVAGYEYLLEFQVFQSVYAKTEVMFDDLKDFPVDLDGFGRVLVCKTNVYEEPFGKREQISIENCTNV